MVGRRHILVAGALALGAACAGPAPEAPTSVVPSPVFNIAAVEVDAGALTPEMTSGVLSPAEVVADIQGRILSELETRSDPSGVPVTVRVTLTSVALISTFEEAIPGAKSRIAGTVAVADAAPRSVTAISDRVRLPGVIGVITAPDRQIDYDETASVFAKEIADAVF